MFEMKSPNDFVVAAPFRWQGILYEEDSSLPAGMPQAAMIRFLHRDPPLIKALLIEAERSNGTPRKKTHRAPRKKTRKKKAAKRAR